MKNTTPQCAVPGCENEAELEVFLYDFYSDATVFFEQDKTCGFICAKHAAENEAKAKGVRRPRGVVVYPYTNQHSAQGFTIYKPL